MQITEVPGSWSGSLFGHPDSLLYPLRKPLSRFAMCVFRSRYPQECERVYGLIRVRSVRVWFRCLCPRACRVMVYPRNIIITICSFILGTFSSVQGPLLNSWYVDDPLLIR